MNKLRQIFSRAVFIQLRGLVVESREEGQTLVEYGLILVLIALIVAVAVTFLSGQLSTLFSNVGDSL